MPEASTPFTLPTGTVTFLLTDVEGSTRLWQDAPEVMGAVIARHYDLLNEAIARFNGVRPVEQGEGDSVVGAFARTSDALAAALDAQRALAREDWPAGIDLRVRMAVHTGEAEQRGEQNYVGPSLIRCARIRSAGHGGQVLVSESAVAVARDALPEGAELVDLGAHRLKDLARPERIWSLTHPDLPEVDAPLRSLDAFRHNLPVQPTPLIGRRSEVRAIVGELGRDRLVTLTGAGGVGKTRLAAQAAAELVDRFPGGVWWVELAPLHDGTAIAATLLAAMGANEDGARPAPEVVIDRLSSSTALVVLDNCEHLIGPAAELVATLLGRCPDLVVLATSREPLGVPAEVTWRVPSLSLPPADAPSTIEALSQYDAVRLFLDRARRARPQLALTDVQIAAVADICHRLDGVPLAIELAAARCRQLPPEQINQQLHDRFRLLTGGSRTLMPRQQTLLASVEWSYDLLDDDERRILERLAVFSGPFRLEAAEAVASAPGDVEPWTVFDVVGRLVDKSLVVPGEFTDTAGQTNAEFRLLETVRQFALDRTTADLVQLRDAHADWWAAELERLDARNPSWAAIDVVSHHRSDLRAALDWLEPDPDRRHRLLGLVGVAWAWAGHTDDVLDYADRWIVGGPGDHAIGPWAQAFAGSMSAIFGGARWDAFAHLQMVLDVLLEAEDGRGLLSPYLWVAGQANPALLDATIEFGIRDGAHNLLDAHGGLVFNLLLDVDASAAGRWLDQLQHVGRTTDGPTHLLGLLLHDLGDHNAVSLTRYAAGYRSWPAEPAWLGERCLMDRMLIQLGIGMLAFTDGDRSHLEWAIANLGEHRSLPTAEEWRVGLAAFLTILDGEPPTADERFALSWFTSSARTSLRYLPCRALMAADGIDEAAAVLVTFAWPGASTIARHLVEATLALHDDRVLDADRSIAAAAEASLGHPWIESQPDLLELAAIAAGRLGQPERAVRLAAAAEPIRLRTGVTYRWADQDRWLAEVLATAAEELDTAGVDEARERGATMAIAEALQLIVRGRGGRRRTTSGWDSLTRTERQVADLVAQGLTNPQIAEALIMGRATVKTHVSHCFTKLGITNRIELATLAQQRQDRDRS